MWIKNLLQYDDTGHPSNCPKCNSSQVIVTVHKYKKRKSISFYCEKCGAADHFDGIGEEDNGLRSIEH